MGVSASEGGAFQSRPLCVADHDLFAKRVYRAILSHLKDITAKAKARINELTSLVLAFAFFSCCGVYDDGAKTRELNFLSSVCFKILARKIALTPGALPREHLPSESLYFASELKKSRLRSLRHIKALKNDSRASEKSKEWFAGKVYFEFRVEFSAKRKSTQKGAFLSVFFEEKTYFFLS